MADAFDLIVIGGGSGGSAVARRAAGYGAKVAIIERGVSYEGTTRKGAGAVHPFAFPPSMRCARRRTAPHCMASLHGTATRNAATKEPHCRCGWHLCERGMRAQEAHVRLWPVPRVDGRRRCPRRWLRLLRARIGRPIRLGKISSGSTMTLNPKPGVMTTNKTYDVLNYSSRAMHCTRQNRLEETAPVPLHKNGNDGDRKVGLKPRHDV